MVVLAASLDGENQSGSEHCGGSGIAPKPGVQGVGALVFSLEMRVEQLAMRLLTSRAVSSQRLRRVSLTKRSNRNWPVWHELKMPGFGLMIPDTLR